MSSPLTCLQSSQTLSHKVVSSNLWPVSSYHKLSHKVVLSTPLTCLQSSQTITQGCIEYTSDLFPVISKSITRLYWVHLCPASSHHKLNNIMLHWVHLWPASSHHKLLSHTVVLSTPLTCCQSPQTIAQGCIDYTSDLPPDITNYHIRLCRVHLWSASSHHKIYHILLYWVHLWPASNHHKLSNRLYWVHLWPASSHHKLSHKVAVIFRLRSAPVPMWKRFFFPQFHGGKFPIAWW